MSDFTVVVPVVEHVAGRCRSLGADLSAELMAVRREAQLVLDGEWRGTAARAFEREWSAWEAGAREVIAALDRLADLLATTGHAYVARDEVSADALRRISL